MEKYKKLFGSWYEFMLPFLESEDFKAIGKFLKKEYDIPMKTIIPALPDIFRAFKFCPLDELVCVFLTLNSYVNGEGHDGMAFSSVRNPSMIDFPPVLTKIFDAVEVDTEKGLYLDRDPDLKRWAKQGVLLLNIDLTSELGKVGAHVKLWQPFIEYVIRNLVYHHSNPQFVFVGKAAHEYKKFIEFPETIDMYTLEHPLIAIKEDRPWENQQCFRRINQISQFLNNKTIQWS